MGLFDPHIEGPQKEISFILADRMRPRTLDEIVGQEHLLGNGRPLRKMIESDKLRSIILWGPPGSGKTTIAYVISRVTGMDFLSYSAVLAGIKEVKQVISQAEKNLYLYGKHSILFIDEIHRFNKAQQDAFLPYVEKGSIILIGATTENPSFEIISPLLSRVQVFVLKPLKREHIELILLKALIDKERGLGRNSEDISREALDLIIDSSSGDARFALNLLELSFSMVGDGKVTRELVSQILQRGKILYDKSGEEHYNIISALHKSIRDSDPDGALYWLARMLEGGEDRRYILRRLVRMAIEDVGLADPNALLMATSAWQAFDYLGIPEGDLALAELAVYLAYAPKSNSVYCALDEAIKDVHLHGSLPVPLHIRNAPTRLMKELGYGRGYKYAHDFEEHVVEQTHLPTEIEGHKYYHPTEQGFEKRIKERFEEIKRILERRRKHVGEQ